jgi:uncharacterized protein YndB with AHSA1/START domain
MTMATPTTADTTLHIQRTFRATPERLFKAWTEPDQVARWFAPSGDFTVRVDRLDVRAGGRYRIEMHRPDGNVHTAIGEYLEISPSTRLVFTWAWEGEAMADTRVTVSLRAVGDSTELTLTHERFPDVDTRDQHAQGWAGCLTLLERAIGG